MNRPPLWKVASVILLVWGLQLYGQPADAGAAAKAASFIAFDVPGSSCAARFPRCTTPVAINPAGAITGYYADANAALHSFLRARDRTFTTFDPPGSTCPFFFSSCSQPADINPEGAIVGISCDAIGCHGFLRTRDGTLTTFDPPGSFITQANGINPGGAVTGYYLDALSTHGFLRARDGTFTTFDPPGPEGAFPTASTRRAPSQDTTTMQISWITASYAPATVPSPPSIRRAQ